VRYAPGAYEGELTPSIDAFLLLSAGAKAVVPYSDTLSSKANYYKRLLGRRYKVRRLTYESATVERII
jgi:hypothetical protein